MVEQKYTKSFLAAVHKHSSYHRAEIESAIRMMCFHCKNVISPLLCGDVITEWIDSGQTALCPLCGIDSLLGYWPNSSFIFNNEFIEAMHNQYFGVENEKIVSFCKGKKAVKALIIEDEKDLDINTVMFDAHHTAVEKGFWDDNNPNLGEKLMLVCTEVAEAMEEIRNGVDLREVVINQGKPEGFGVELADVIIRVLDLAGHLDLDIASLIRLKMRYNNTRPKKNGKQC